MITIHAQTGIATSSQTVVWRCDAEEKHGLVRQLPDDLALMAETELSEHAAVRDQKLALFRRWPALSRSELGQLRQIYAERLKIARYLGRRRRDSGHPLTG